MLSDKIFAKYFGELLEWYGKPKSQVASDSYYAWLSHLKDDDFINAVGAAICKLQRFPTADQLIELSRGGRPEENAQAYQDFDLPALPSSEERMTPEQKAEAVLRGRLIARTILNATGLMTPEQKDALIEQLKQKPTHELEAIASTAQTSQNHRKFNNIANSLKNYA
ncbi:hypothetical protein [Aulosira sp. FACHB-615]|uniref:hypothetical protein n=1 Tax=Aulosira sp. FACHB-615 TaxID=2692777 RepID=UPI001682B11F|nr:hypothetical protein [Aulosira sp. FACHB-615]MBD2492626.1 hypothetical protein [Aulosira sp. FACHB-615]